MKILMPQKIQKKKLKKFLLKKKQNLRNLLCKPDRLFLEGFNKKMTKQKD